MFGQDQENKLTSEPRPATTDQPDNIYVMPAKFHSQKQSEPINKILIIVSIILLAVVVVSGSYFIYDFWSTAADKAPAPAVTVDANQNQNANANINENLNRNINRGFNANANVNANTNANLNANENVNANLNTNTNTNTNTNQEVIPVLSGDADRDGLTDLEEGLMGTSPSAPDSDQDGYLDGVEVVNGYNPAVATASGGNFRLKDADYIAELVTGFPANNFRTLYIRGWSVSQIVALHQARIITATGEMIKISVADNPDKISAANWYLLNHPQASLSQLDSISFGDFQGVYSPTGLAAYLVDSSRDKLYIFEYDLDDRAEFRYPTIFEMIIKNFELSAGQPLSGGNDEQATTTQF